MQSSTNNRTNNIDATNDSHNRRGDYLNKRQVARLRKSVDVAAATIYARIRWNWSLYGTDGSECQLVDSAGADLSPTQLGWIDGFDGLLRVAPDLFGDVYYEVADTQTTATRGGTTRELYRATRRAGVVSATRIFEMEYITAGCCYVRDVAGRITTSINGAAVNNVLHCQTSFVTHAAAQRWDCQLPTRYAGSYVDAIGGITAYPSLVCDILQTSRKRSGRAVGASSGAATVTLSSLSIDLGEYFVLTILTNDRATSGTVIDAVAFTETPIGIYSTATGTIVAAGLKAGIAIGAKVSSTTATTSAFTSATVTGSSASTTALTVSNAPSTSTTTLTVTITFDATTARITTIAVANSAATNSFAVSVEGGRPAWQALGTL